MADDAELERRFRYRRRVATWSFALMSAMFVCLIIVALQSETAVDRISRIQWLIGTASGLWSSIVLGYFALSSYEQGKITPITPSK